MAYNKDFSPPNFYNKKSDKLFVVRHNGNKVEQDLCLGCQVAEYEGVSIEIAIFALGEEIVEIPYYNIFETREAAEASITK